ncbi:solute carrier family 67 member A1 isoform X1 [Callithrix jacchus]|uniref:solute carrier family 22 member 18 isoform X1 n=1 Tax=Callithrix jacchus TaxID=9483 RepID=UPI00159D247A|nr:solute carrier family 22 member 18 isoform X1 [Callithrix jacchus]
MRKDRCPGQQESSPHRHPCPSPPLRRQARLRGCCLGPSDSAPPPRSTGLLAPAPPASCLDLSWVLLRHLPRMQGAWAPRDQGQSHSRMGALDRPLVILLTYVLATIEFTCLFMQFSIVPASQSAGITGVSHRARPISSFFMKEREGSFTSASPLPRAETFHRQSHASLRYHSAAWSTVCGSDAYLSRKLGLDSIAFGYLQTIFGVLQLLCGPVFGRFADQRGARAALTLSFLAALALYLLLVAASSPALPGVYLLFASRLPGALMHTMPAAQMVITDLLAPEERPAALGRLGLCFGGGVILGSLLGGTLISAYGIQCPAILAAVATLLGAVLSFTCIPTSTKGARTDAQAPPPGSPWASVFDLKAIASLLRLPDVPRIFLVKVASNFPSGLFMIMFSIISMDFFRLEAAQTGYLMSFFGLLQMVTQGLVIGWLSSHFSEEALLRASVLVFIVVGLAMASMSSVFHFCLLVPGLVLSLCTLNVVTDSMLTKAVSSSDTGTMLGLCASVQPLLRTLGPTLGGLLYRSFGVPIFGHVQIAVNVLVLLLLWRKPVPQRKDKVR